MKERQVNKTGQKGTLLKVLQHIRRYWFLLICSLVCAAVSVIMTLYVPILTGRAIDSIIAPGKVAFDTVFQTLKMIAVVTAFNAIAQWLMNLCNNQMTFNIVRDIRVQAFEKIEILPLSYLDAHSHGEIVSRVITDADQFADGLLMGFTQLFSGIITIVGTLVFMFSLDPGISLLVAAITPLSLFSASFIARHTYHMFHLQSETRGEQTACIEEMISGQQVIQAYGREAQVKQHFDEINQRLADASLKAIFFSSITNPSTRFVNSLAYAAVAFTGALSAVGGRISIGQLSCFLSYANQYTKPFNEISGVIAEFQNALACAARIFELIEEKPQLPDAADAVVLSGVDGKVDLEEVCFSYVPERSLIRNFTLHVLPGQRVAIVGPTGCGKTTIINLLMRFYDVQSGSIQVMQKDIRSITRHSLRAAYGMVLQETWLKNASVWENIRMGKADASQEEIVQAAKAAHAHSFIQRLPHGYDTLIGEDGGILSQGEKQLLCIARVMLCLPPMLILDEATSSIDIRTEILIQDAFSEMMRGHTSFIVAHRLSTIQNADIILVMRDGKVVEQGNHQTLLNQNGFYAELYNSQFVS